MAGEPSTLGFIGLGTMGGRMCRNLAHKSGKPVVGYDLAPERIADCAGAGVRASASVSDVAARADLVFICVPGEPQVRRVRFGPDGLVEHARAGRIVVDMSAPEGVGPVRGRRVAPSASSAGASPARRRRLHVP